MMTVFSVVYILYLILVCVIGSALAISAIPKATGDTRVEWTIRVIGAFIVAVSIITGVILFSD